MIKQQNQKLPSYIRPIEKDSTVVQISVRIPNADKTKFEAAQATLRLHNYDMNLTDVIRDAIQGAVTLVDAHFSKK